MTCRQTVECGYAIDGGHRQTAAQCPSPAAALRHRHIGSAGGPIAVKIPQGDHRLGGQRVAVEGWSGGLGGYGHLGGRTGRDGLRDGGVRISGGLDYDALVSGALEKRRLGGIKGDFAGHSFRISGSRQG